ncbi:hypothetical protein ACIPIN_08650 [Pseudomonas sp. NPDC087697]|uniref:hypothetical protein n=1 Tax=Pseudomonas sp. NPDC087697 TaxID=3364447 RepID=UPI0037F6A65A
MIPLTELQTLVVRLAEGGIAAPALRREVMRLHPELTDSKYLSELLSLQDQRRLFGDEITGVWVFTSVSDEDIKNSALEYSPQFAEMITATDCGEWQDIDADDMIAELEAMLQKAQARKHT